MKRTYHLDDETIPERTEETTFDLPEKALTMEEKIALIKEKTAEICDRYGYNVDKYNQEMRRLVRFGNALGIWDGFEYSYKDKRDKEKHHAYEATQISPPILGEHTERVMQKRRKQNPKENEHDREEVKEHLDSSIASDTLGKGDFTQKHNKEKKKHQRGCVLM